jgi:hypothetical protein
MSYPFNLYVYGVPEGRVRSMGGSHMGKESNGMVTDRKIILVVPTILKLAVPIVVPIAIFYFQLSLGSNLVFFSNSLTERARQI